MSNVVKEDEQQAASEADAIGGEATASPPSGPSAEDMAAHDYQKLQPIFLDMITHMPKKQMVRVFKSIIEYPLETQAPKFSYEAEKRAFYVGMQLFDCKFIIMKAVLELTKDSDAMKKLNDDVLALEAKSKETA